MGTRKRTDEHDVERLQDRHNAPVRIATVRHRRALGLGGKVKLNGLGQGDHSDDKARGLHLRVRGTSSTWLVRYSTKSGTKRGVQKRLTLGPLNGGLVLDLQTLGLQDQFPPPVVLDLSTARDVAKAITGLASTGRDPLAELQAEDQARAAAKAAAVKRAKDGTASLGALVTRYLEHREVSKKPKLASANTMNHWRSILRAEILPTKEEPDKIGAADPRELKRADIVAWHNKISEDRPTWANRCVELLSMALKWAVREETLTASPCVDIVPNEEKPRDRTLKSSEVKATWEAELVEPEPFADAWKLLWLTAVRKSECLQASWSEFDLEARLWTIPADRSKNGRARLVPLSQPALELLQRRQANAAECSWVFPSPGRSGAPLVSLASSLRRVWQRSGTKGWTVHDIRRTVATGLGDLSVRPDVVEDVLGHARPKLRGTYNLSQGLPEMRSALEAWSRHLQAIISGVESAENVLPFVAR